MTIILLSLLLLTACAHRPLIHDLQTGETIHEQELVKRLPNEGYIVFGEQHYSPSLQRAMANLMRKVVEDKQAQERFTLGWEFLNFPDQKNIDRALEEWRGDKMDDSVFLLALFKNTQSAQRHEMYLPVLKSVRDEGGQLLAVNAPREWKRDPSGFEFSCPQASTGYWKRFKLAMEGHVKEAPLKKYFEAQNYTDCVMAHSLNNNARHELRFLITGSFHADYNDGVVPLLEKAVHIKFLNAEQLSEEKLNELKSPHEKYGRIADYLYVIP